MFLKSATMPSDTKPANSNATGMASHDVETQPLIASVENECEKNDDWSKGWFPLGLSSTAMLIIYYSLCSSTMLVINKVTIEYIPMPSFVMLCQLTFTASVARGGHAVGAWEVDPLEWQKVFKFTPVILAFLGGIFASMKVLQSSNVETFITFRSSTPLVLSVADYWFLGRALPNISSLGCLAALLAGSVGYVLTDTAFMVNTYYWLLIWYIFYIFDCVYGKHICETVKMTNWSRVYYTNILTIPFLLCIFPAFGEPAELAHTTWEARAIIPLILSCLVGVGMSHASYCLRDNCSATLFTLVGILCKVITVIINLMIWNKHASLEGIGFLFVCVGAGTFYQQAPMRSQK